MRRALHRALSCAACCVSLGAAAQAEGDAASFVRFVQEPSANCVMRNGVLILVQNTHPSRKLRVWLDRMHMGVGTGDRSRSDLDPGAEPEPLGCSRNLNGAQEWRVVRAAFID
jgi:hypothetical protein